MENQHNPNITYYSQRIGSLSDAAVGMRIREARKSMYMTQSELADYLGVSTSYVSCLERGARPLTHNITLSLLRCLNVSYDYLVMGNYPNDTGFISSVCEASSYDERLKLERLLEQCTKSEYEMCYKLCSAYLEASRVEKGSKHSSTPKPKSSAKRKIK